MVGIGIKKAVFWTVILSAVYFFLRLTRITTLPLFTDEAIYTRWSQIASQDASWRFISLTDGKQPLFIWLNILAMKYMPDPLLAGRLVSVGVGALSVIGIFFLTAEIFKKRVSGNLPKAMFGHLANQKTVGLFASILLIFYPFSLVMDRMAMYDGLVVCTMVWSLYFEILLVRYVRLDVALLTGAVIGSALLTKTSGFFAIYLLPFSLLLFDWRQKTIGKRLVKFIILAGISVASAYGIYMILRLSPYYYIIDEKNSIFVYPLGEWIKHPFAYLEGNSRALIEWMLAYVSIPVFILFLSAFILGWKKLLPEKLLLLVWFLIPFIALGIFGKLLYPRFILFMTMPILVLAAYSLNCLYTYIKNKLIFFLILAASLALFIRADYYVVFDFPHAPIATPDLGQYINSWPAGGGIKEMVAFFDSESNKGKIYVATQGTFGSLPTYAMEIYLNNNKNIEKRGIYPLPEFIPQDLKDRASYMPVYVVFNDSEIPPSLWPLKPIAKYQKGIGDRHLSIYQVNP